jgi:hypothetical protein
MFEIITDVKAIIRTDTLELFGFGASVFSRDQYAYKVAVLATDDGCYLPLFRVDEMDWQGEHTLNTYEHGADVFIGSIYRDDYRDYNHYNALPWMQSPEEKHRLAQREKGYVGYPFKYVPVPSELCPDLEYALSVAEDYRALYMSQHA